MFLVNEKKKYANGTIGILKHMYDNEIDVTITHADGNEQTLRVGRGVE